MLAVNTEINKRTCAGCSGNHRGAMCERINELSCLSWIFEHDSVRPAGQFDGSRIQQEDLETQRAGPVHYREAETSPASCSVAIIGSEVQRQVINHHWCFPG